MLKYKEPLFSLNIPFLFFFAGATQAGYIITKLFGVVDVALEDIPFKEVRPKLLSKKNTKIGCVVVTITTHIVRFFPRGLPAPAEAQDCKASPYIANARSRKDPRTKKRAKNISKYSVYSYEVKPWKQQASPLFLVQVDPRAAQNDCLPEIISLRWEKNGWWIEASQL